MKFPKLRFTWDPQAIGGNDETFREEKQKGLKRLEDYFDFIEQFTVPDEENKPDEHVDKKFSLSP
jgi:hypothetical protein